MKKVYICFIKLLLIHLRLTLLISQLEIRSVFIIDNTRIHKIERIIKLVKDCRLVVFTIPSYSPGLNHTFYS